MLVRVPADTYAACLACVVDGSARIFTDRDSPEPCTLTVSYTAQGAVVALAFSPPDRTKTVYYASPAGMRVRATRPPPAAR
jgi:hypothetical protein